MLEARLLVKLARAQMLWELDYGNDAQGEVSDAMAMAVDTEWEDRLDKVLNPEYNPTLEQLTELFLSNHPGSTKADLDIEYAADKYTPIYGKLYGEFHEYLVESDNQNKHNTIVCLDSLIDQICNAIGDKIHRRNLQINDLKREPERLKARINRATSVVNSILADISGGKLEILADMSTDDLVGPDVLDLRERIGKVNLALLG